MFWLDDNSIVYTRSTGKNWDHTPFTLNPTDIYLLDLESKMEQQITHMGNVDEIVNCYENNTILFKTLGKHTETSVVDQRVNDIYSVNKECSLLNINDLSINEIILPDGQISPGFEMILQQDNKNMKIVDLESMMLLDKITIPVTCEDQSIKWLTENLIFIGCQDESLSPIIYIYDLSTRTLQEDTLLTEEKNIFNSFFQIAPNKKWYSASKLINRNYILYYQYVDHQNIYLISNDSMYGIWSPNSKNIAYIEKRVDSNSNIMELLKVEEIPFNL